MQSESGQEIRHTLSVQKYHGQRDSHKQNDLYLAVSLTGHVDENVTRYTADQRRSIYLITLKVLEHAGLAVREDVKQYPNIVLTTMYDNGSSSLPENTFIAMRRRWPGIKPWCDLIARVKGELRLCCVNISDSGTLHLAVRCYSGSEGEATNLVMTHIVKRYNIEVLRLAEKMSRSADHDEHVKLIFSILSADVPKLLQAKGDTPPFLPLHDAFKVFLCWIASKRVHQLKTVSLLSSGELLLHDLPDLWDPGFCPVQQTTDQLADYLKKSLAFSNGAKALANNTLLRRWSEDHSIPSVLLKPDGQMERQPAERGFLEEHPEKGLQTLSVLIKILRREQPTYCTYCTYCMFILWPLLAKRLGGDVSYYIIVSFMVHPDALNEYQRQKRDCHNGVRSPLISSSVLLTPPRPPQVAEAGYNAAIPGEHLSH